MQAGFNTRNGAAPLAGAVGSSVTPAQVAAGQTAPPQTTSAQPPPATTVTTPVPRSAATTLVGTPNPAAATSLATPSDAQTSAPSSAMSSGSAAPGLTAPQTTVNGVSVPPASASSQTMLTGLITASQKNPAPGFVTGTLNPQTPGPAPAPAQGTLPVNLPIGSGLANPANVGVQPPTAAPGLVQALIAAAGTSTALSPVLSPALNLALKPAQGFGVPAPSAAAVPMGSNLGRSDDAKPEQRSAPPLVFGSAANRAAPVGALRPSGLLTGNLQPSAGPAPSHRMTAPGLPASTAQESSGGPAQVQRALEGNSYRIQNQSVPTAPDVASAIAGKQRGNMLSPEGVNMMPRPNTVYVEGAAAGVRVEPEQARVLGLRAGETINAVVTQRQDGNVLLIGKQQLPLPDRLNLPAGQISLLVRVVAGQTILALTDPALAAQVAAKAQRSDADARFARLLNHVGSFHLGRILSPGALTALVEQSGSQPLQRSLAALLLDSRQLGSQMLRTAMENTGLFAEHQARQNPQQALPGLKSMLLTLRAMMQARQLETTTVSGAIDEIEARQIDSLAQQSAGRTHYSWVLPFADQYPVYIELEYQQSAPNEEGASQTMWNVDLEVGLTASVAMAANVRVDQHGGLGLRLWLPHPDFYRLAQENAQRLESMLQEQGLSLTGLTVYPVPRDSGKVDYGQGRMGVSIDA